jgi:hypothetical protein
MTPEPSPVQRVVVVDFDMSIGNMVAFLIKLAFAAIPAAVIIGVLFAVIAGVFTAVMR